MNLSTKEKMFLAAMLESKKENSKRALARMEMKMQNPVNSRKDYEPLKTKHKEIVTLCDGLLFGIYSSQQKAQ